MVKKKYKQDIYCQNCNNSSIFSIPFGVTIDEFMAIITIGNSKEKK